MPYPATSLKDDFNRVDNALLGANWTEAVIGSTNRALISANHVTTSGAGASSSNAYTGTGTVTGKYIAMDYLVLGFPVSATTDVLGHAAAVVANTATGYRTELNPLGTDLVVAFLRTDGTVISSVTCTGKGQIQVNDRIGLLVNDNNTTVALEFWVYRAATWTQWASVTASGANYIAGPYYPGFRVKYPEDIIDDFNAALGSANTVPSAPALTAATPGDSQVALTWLPPVSDGGSAVTGYKVYRGTTAGAEALLATPAGTGTTYTDSTPVNGTTYYYVVTALNAVGESPISNEVSATPVAPPVLSTAVRTLKRLVGPALLSNAAATLYTVPAGTSAVIRHIHVSNPSGSPVPLTLSIGADTVGRRLWDGEAVAAGDIIDHISEHVMVENEVIQAFGGTGSVLNLTVDGYELVTTFVAAPDVVYPGAGIFPSDFPAYPDDSLLPH